MCDEECEGEEGKGRTLCYQVEATLWHDNNVQMHNVFVVPRVIARRGVYVLCITHLPVANHCPGHLFGALQRREVFQEVNQNEPLPPPHDFVPVHPSSMKSKSENIGSIWRTPNCCSFPFRKNIDELEKRGDNMPRNINCLIGYIF